MEMNELLLQQAAEAFENLRGAHRLLIGWYPKLAPDSAQLHLRDRLLEVDRELFWQLMIAIPVSALYAAQYARQAHRYSRVTDLLNRCCIIHGNLCEAFITFSSATSVNYSTRVYQQFSIAGKILETAQRSLKRSIPRGVILARLNQNEETRCVGRLQNKPIDEKQETEAAPLVPAEYFRERSRYEWERQALCLKAYLTRLELDLVVLQETISPFQRFLPDRKPIYGRTTWVRGEDFETHVEEIGAQVDNDDSSKERPRCRCYRYNFSTKRPKAWRSAEESDDESNRWSQRHGEADKNRLLRDFDSVNAIWHSMLAAGRVEKRSEEEYKKIYRAATSIKVNVLATARKCTASGKVDPVSLAKGLRAIGIWLGIIFRDDIHTVVWPLGRSPESQYREVVVFCHTDTHSPYSFTYQGIKLLGPGQKAVRPPRVEHAFSETKEWSWMEKLHARIDYEARIDYDSDYYDSTELPPGPFDSHFLPSVLAIADQSSRAFTPFPFLRLPAELRNRVYEDYLSQWDSDFEWTTRLELRHYYEAILVPELCQTNHQLLCEVLPLHLARKPLRVDRRPGRAFLKLGAQPVLHDLLRFQHVQFDSFHSRPVPQDILQNISYVELSLKDEKPGFTINTDRFKFMLRLKPKPDPHPRIVTMLEQLKILVTILTEDMQTKGLTLADISAIHEFLDGYTKCPGEWRNEFD